jgi:hypothetical protein
VKFDATGASDRCESNSRNACGSFFMFVSVKNRPPDKVAGKFRCKTLFKTGPAC